MGLYETKEADYEYRKSVREAYNRGYEKGKADAAPKWIPFTAETAPKEDGPYLIKMKTATGNVSVKTDRYSAAYGEWFIYSNDIVIQWMPIP